MTQTKAAAPAKTTGRRKRNQDDDEDEEPSQAPAKKKAAPSKTSRTKKEPKEEDTADAGEFGTGDMPLDVEAEILIFVSSILLNLSPMLTVCLIGWCKTQGNSRARGNQRSGFQVVKIDI